MKYYSTNNTHLRTSFEEAVFGSLPADGGLYMPIEIPRMDPLFLRNLPALSLPEIAVAIARPFIGDSLPKDVLQRIAAEAFDFPAPVRPLDQGLAVLELFHGPSLAFKDFGARFMSRVLGHFSQQRGGILDVLVATSGDTGGAVALGFLGVEGTRVTILYPKGKVSPIQELQLTTNGHNVRAIQIDGTFDDCQTLVKQAFLDPDLNRQLQMTSANSINIARLLPQTFYYFHAYGQMLAQGMSDVVFVVPSGNFGNIAAGMLAQRMGLPVRNFVAATNANDTVPRFLKTGRYNTRPAVPTLSNAMDVGAPSNWARIMDLFGGDRGVLSNQFTAFSYSDADTRKAIQSLFDRHGYLACPHTALAWLAAEDYRQQKPNGYASVFLSTAHPCKFPEVFPPELAAQIEIPASVQALLSRKGAYVEMPNDFELFKKFMKS